MNLPVNPPRSGPPSSTARSPSSRRSWGSTTTGVTRSTPPGDSSGPTRPAGAGPRSSPIRARPVQPTPTSILPLGGGRNRPSPAHRVPRSLGRRPCLFGGRARSPMGTAPVVVLRTGSRTRSPASGTARAGVGLAAVDPVTDRCGGSIPSSRSLSRPVRSSLLRVRVVRIPSRDGRAAPDPGRQHVVRRAVVGELLVRVERSDPGRAPALLWLAWWARSPPS